MKFPNETHKFPMEQVEKFPFQHIMFNKLKMLPSVTIQNANR